MNALPDICPCDTDRPYETCCGPLHEGSRPVTIVITLMRSRYSAYALGLRDCLLETWHPNTRPESINSEPRLRWTGLTIEHSRVGKAWDEERMVAFSATWEESGQTGTMREVSPFPRVDGHWFYVNGIPHAVGHHTPEEHEKTRRNGLAPPTPTRGGC